MRKLFQSVLAAKRERRALAVGAALWLLRIVRDVEKEEMYRCSDQLDKLDLEPECVSRLVYAAVEEECIISEYALGVLDYAIEDLEFAY